jgi:hypothetical protein
MIDGGAFGKDHLKHKIMRGNMAEGARFENPEALETIGPDLISSFRSQALTEESGVGETPVKPDRTR